MSKVFTITEGLENMGAIKTGGQGSVYKGRRVGEIITAIKLLPTPIFNQSEEDKHYRDFSNEVKKLQRVNEEPDPNVVKILSYGISETGGFPFIEMEYIDGPDVAELLKPPHHSIFTLKEAIKLADHLSHALAHCHKLDVKHGDIKSNNVKYNRHTGNYVLLDFGLAILSDEDRRTSMRQAGAIEFMAPEQNEGKMLFQTDVYSFGIILYELLAGKVPFPLDGNSETARNKVMVAHMEAAPPDLLSQRASLLPQEWSDEKKALEMQVPEWLISMVYKCLQKRPEDRFSNGVALHEHLSHNRIYTPEVAGLVRGEDNKWQSVVAQKEHELQDLKTIISRQERELHQLRENSPADVGYASQPTYASQRNVVSKSAFNAVLIALVLVGGLAIYSLFFNRSVVGAANTQADTGFAEDSLTTAEEGSVSVYSENKSAAKQAEKKEKAATNTGFVEEENNTTEPVAEQTTSANVKDSVKSEKAQPSGDEAEEKKEEAEADSSETVLYKVKNKAYFHNEPDASSKREAFIIHWNNAVLKPLDEKQGFVYVVFTNHLGQTSKGWLSKADLKQVN